MRQECCFASLTFPTSRSLFNGSSASISSVASRLPYAHGYDVPMSYRSVLACRQGIRVMLSEGASAPTSASGIGLGLVTVTETPKPIVLTVQGSIPAWLRGELLRVGPAIFEACAMDSTLVTFDHWFDAVPFVHRFCIQPNGDVTYSSRNVGRHVQSAVASVATKSNYRAVTVGTIVDPCRNLFSKVFTMFSPQTTDPTNPNAPCYPVGVAIERHAGATGMSIALTTDASTFLSINPETLKPEKFVSYRDLGAEGELACAHGNYDEREDAYYNILSSVSRPKAPMSIVRIKDGLATVVAKTPSVASTYIHSFAMTDSYIIVALGSSRSDGLKILRERCFLSGLRFDSSAETEFYIIDRKRGTHIATYAGKPSFNFHMTNAFEQDGNVIIDICRYDDLTVFQALNVKDMSKGMLPFSEARLTRYTLPRIPLSKAEAESRSRGSMRTDERVLADQHIDLPSINPAHKRKEYSFAYGISVNEHKDLFSAIVKIDVRSGKTSTFSSARRHPSEPIFVPNPESTSGREDDGVVIFVELDTTARTPRSALVVLNASSMEEIARCETPAGTVVPFTFHGDYLATE
jgi:carotenoid cleavage dioxygenase-like enzyme